MGYPLQHDAEFADDRGRTGGVVTNKRQPYCVNHTRGANVKTYIIDEARMHLSATPQLPEESIHSPRGQNCGDYYTIEEVRTSYGCTSYIVQVKL
jgi:hypothetical protein